MSWRVHPSQFEHPSWPWSWTAWHETSLRTISDLMCCNVTTSGRRIFQNNPWFRKWRETVPTRFPPLIVLVARVRGRGRCRADLWHHGILVPGMRWGEVSLHGSKGCLWLFQLGTLFKDLPSSLFLANLHGFSSWDSGGRFFWKSYGNFIISTKFPPQKCDSSVRFMKLVV